jgi:hypothetical protein
MQSLTCFVKKLNRFKLLKLEHNSVDTDDVISYLIYYYLAAAEQEEGPVIISCTLVEALSASVPTDEVLTRLAATRI